MRHALPRGWCLACIKSYVYGSSSVPRLAGFGCSAPYVAVLLRVRQVVWTVCSCLYQHDQGFAGRLLSQHALRGVLLLCSICWALACWLVCMACQAWNALNAGHAGIPLPQYRCVYVRHVLAPICLASVGIPLRQGRSVEVLHALCSTLFV
jgi:hypothetical protein